MLFVHKQVSYHITLKHLLTYMLVQLQLCTRLDTGCVMMSVFLQTVKKKRFLHTLPQSRNITLNLLMQALTEKQMFSRSGTSPVEVEPPLNLGSTLAQRARRGLPLPTPQPPLTEIYKVCLLE